MQRIDMPERPEWRALADEVGFRFHSPDGETYWDETRAYRFSLQEIEKDIEDPTNEVNGMCHEIVDRVVKDERLLRELHVPEVAWNAIKSSWLIREKDLYGRFDLSYDGKGPAKFLEYNADTPTSLYESSAFQWWWLEALRERNLLPSAADQFNSIEEKLVDAWKALRILGKMYLTYHKDSEEDRGTVVYLQELAKRAGLSTSLIELQDIGVDAQGRFTDLDDLVIENLFKLFPWEWLAQGRYGTFALSGQTRILEPVWKMVLSNKGLMALLWRYFPNHPNLLPTFFEGDAAGLSSLGSSYVRKPLFSREGANVEIVDAGATTLAVEGAYSDGPKIIQAFHPIPRFGNDYAVIGSWVIANQAAGIGIREDNTLVTRNTSRFVPHFID
jgi:glutathionylspermidine synthase